MDQLVPIGRFSKMTRLSVKALRHYDDIGILRPASVDAQSGYRYYRLGQANEAEAIRTLRSLDMPLDEIAAVLNADDPDVVAKTLEVHRARLAASIEEQRRRLAFISRLITGEEPVVPYTVETKTVQEQLVAALRRTTDLATVGATIAQGFPALFGAVVAAGQQPAGMPFIVYHDIIDEETDGDIELCIPVVTDFEPAGDVTCRSLEVATMASVVHKGPYDEVSPAYHVITAWMAEHGHAPAGPPRELYLNDPTQVPESELLTEVQWPFE